MKFFTKTLFFLLLILIVPLFSHAQTLSQEQRAILEQQLSQVEAERVQAENDLKKTQAQSTSLQNDIAVLTARIKAAQLSIKAKTLLIQTLGNDIVIKQNHINDLEDHITNGKETLADILRKTNEIDNTNLPILLLSQKSLTNLFQDIDAFESVHEGLEVTIDKLRNDQASTTKEKEALDARRNAELDAKYTIEQEQKNIQADENQKRQLLAISKGNEKAYSSLISQKKAKAAEIRARLFALRDTAAIPFGQALQYANIAAEKTGVRPAFLLAILMQESALGSNVGQCYVTNLQTGAGVYAKTGNAVNKVMSPTRDIPPFVTIMKQIGGDPTRQVVSCPLEIGWGGAMGPAQFIASTWILFEDRIVAALNLSSMPDPWNPAHAFMASAIYLADLGASQKTYTAERNAACKYYSGRACGAVSGNTTYGNQVVSKAETIQRTMINPLQGL